MSCPCGGRVIAYGPEYSPRERKIYAAIECENCGLKTERRIDPDSIIDNKKLIRSMKERFCRLKEERYPS